MKIGIDARKIRDFGIGAHIENLLKYIPQFDQENEYYIFYYPEDKDYVPQTGSNIKLVSDTSPKYSIQELVVLPFKMGKLRLNLFHAPHYTLPPLRPCRGVVTIHDVIHLRFPEYLPHPAAYYYAKNMMWIAAKSAQKVITVSECSKQDIVLYLGVPEEKIVVVYNGIEPPGVQQDIRGLDEHFGISRPYILYLGNFMPHKNLDTLVKAYGLLKCQHHIPHKLVLAGKNDRLRQTLEHLVAEEKLRDDVMLTGFVEQEYVPALYAHADLFVYPSLYEGFGLQALEAMSYQIPVVISSVAALPETAGDAALLCDPGSPENMAAVMYQALTDQALRRTLIERGTTRLQRFSWQAMAQQTVSIYHSVLRLN